MMEPGRQFADYQGLHRPTEGGPPAHDLTQPGNFMEGSDVYEHPQYYTGTAHPAETVRQLRAVRGKPEALVNIYRAAPSPHINPGDWVTMSKGYAREHAKHPTDPKQDLPVHRARVPAKHVHFAGDDLNEYGYYGPAIKGERQ